MESVRDQVTDLHKDFESLKSEFGRVSDQLLGVQTCNSELQEENAKILQHNTELRTENAEIRIENAEIRKENADLKAQVVSDSVNHTIFPLSISSCSRMLSTIVLL